MQWAATGIHGYKEGEERYSTLVGSFKVTISRPYGYSHTDGKTWFLRTYDGGPGRAKMFGGHRLFAKSADDAKVEAAEVIKRWAADLIKDLG